MGGPEAHTHLMKIEGVDIPVMWPSSVEQCPQCHVCSYMLEQPQYHMVLCPECGNKRCPKATNHLHSCSGSNQSGQVGSTYGEDCPNECCAVFYARWNPERERVAKNLAELRAQREARKANDD